MTEKIIGAAVAVICVIRTVSYGIYTARGENKTGAVGAFAMAAMAAAASVYFFVK